MNKLCTFMFNNELVLPSTGNVEFKLAEALLIAFEAGTSEK